MPPVPGRKSGESNGYMSVRREQLAINLFDLDRVEPIVRQILLAGKLDLSSAIWVDRSRLDETAVVFTCDLLRAASICDLIRNDDRKRSRYPTRIYLKKVEAWERLSASTVLCQVEDGKCSLAEDIFPPEEKQGPVLPPESRPTVFGESFDE